MNNLFLILTSNIILRKRMGVGKSDPMLSPNIHTLSQNKNKVLTVRNILGLLKVSDDSYMVKYAFFFH